MDQIIISLTLILLPGIFSVVIADKITVHSHWNSFKYSLYVIVFGVAAYGIVQVLLWLLNIIQSCFKFNVLEWQFLSIWHVVTNGGKDLNGIDVVFAMMAALPVSLLAAGLVNHKILNRFARFINVSTKYGDENLYSYYLNSDEVDWVYVRDQSANLTYQGRIDSFSENQEMQELVLGEVSVYRYTDSEFLYEIPNMYLSRRLGSLTIESIPKDYLEATI